MRWLAILILTASLAQADGDDAGAFDYYVLSLSWTPTWCALEERNRKEPQCDPDKGFGWVLHGLWPQYEQGWPSYCRTSVANPSRAETAAMADIMGSRGQAWYQWKKHGRCSGLSAKEYFAAAREAYESVTMPKSFNALPKPIKLPAALVEEAFLQANPGWRPDMLTITCKAGRIYEARLCLTRDLKPRLCGEDVVDDCDSRNALLDPIR